jgi:hypothetical protein
MEQKLRELFDLEWIKHVAEKNIHDSAWIEDGYRILVIETLVDGAHGAYIPGMVLEMFGQADGYDLEDPYNEQNDTIHDTLMCLENEINFYLNQLLPSPRGTFFVGHHPDDGSYCLFYEEEYEKEEGEQN